MFLFEMGRKVNRYLKQRRQIEAGRWMHPVRRIERTAPLANGRVVAMTFDDGPSAAPPNPMAGSTAGQGLTSVLLEVLKEYKARGTFDVIGTTEYNYPDKAGRLGTAAWGGIRYDHYPDFGQDSLAGVANQLELARRVVDGGHELANHGFAHILFGPMRFIYGKRDHFKGLDQVILDLRRLHQLVEEELGFTMRLSRPPHYIDGIPGGYTSYDAYRLMGYQYLAASFDGGGWKPGSGDYKKDVDLMVEPLRRILQKDAGALNGQIIFQKDGCNMSKQTPVVHALGGQLRLLADEGYQIITVSELLKRSPFTDIDDRAECFEAVRSLEQAGFCIGYRNNTFQPERILTRGELAMMTVPSEILKKAESEGPAFDDVPPGHPYAAGIAWVSAKGWMSSQDGRFQPEQAVTAGDFEEFLQRVAAGKNINWNAPRTGNKQSGLQRRDVVQALAGLMI
ncbi:MAG: S-layer homology domain-containing protein [Deltaproteobacteria bacterium]